MTTSLGIERLKFAAIDSLYMTQNSLPFCVHPVACPSFSDFNISSFVQCGFGSLNPTGGRTGPY